MPFLKFGGAKVLAVSLDTTMWGSRWYPVAGIYRNVWLVKTAPVHVAQWGVSVTTEDNVANLAVTVDNQSATPTTVSVNAEIAGATPAAPVSAEIPAGDAATVKLAVTVPGAKQWDL